MCAVRNRTVRVACLVLTRGEVGIHPAELGVAQVCPCWGKSAVLHCDPAVVPYSSTQRLSLYQSEEGENKGRVGLGEGEREKTRKEWEEDEERGRGQRESRGRRSREGEGEIRMRSREGDERGSVGGGGVKRDSEITEGCFISETTEERKKKRR